MDLTKLSALEIATAIKAGETTSQAVIRALLERIEDREPDVDAWEYLNPDAAYPPPRNSTIIHRMG